MNSEDATAGFPVETLVFDTWDSVQNVLTGLREEGDVRPAGSGGGPSRRPGPERERRRSTGVRLQHRHRLGEVAGARMPVPTVDQRRLLDRTDSCAFQQRVRKRQPEEGSRGSGRRRAG